MNRRGFLAFALCLLAPPAAALPGMPKLPPGAYPRATRRTVPAPTRKRRPSRQPK